MKLKRWLSRGIVLAMVVALMVPMPVAAKSSKAGGKLVKSVEVYDVNTAGKFQLDNKTTYTYDKKKNPKEIKNTGYGSYWFGIPTRGGSSVETLKYKYKGSTPKSMVVKDGAGFVNETRTYKKGKVVSIVTDSKSASEQKDGKVSSSVSSEKTFVTYYKNGLASASSSQNSSAWAYGTEGSSDAWSWNASYGVVEKKGIPSLIVSFYTSGDKDGKLTTIDYKDYTKFNDKGLAVESGYIDNTGKYVPEVSVTYVMKKGSVKEAYIYKVDEKGELTPQYMLKFKYTKTKISKARYMNMMNDLVDFSVEMNAEDDYWADAVNGFFSWY